MERESGFYWIRIGRHDPELTGDKWGTASDKLQLGVQ